MLSNPESGSTAACTKTEACTFHCVPGVERIQAAQLQTQFRKWLPITYRQKQDSFSRILENFGILQAVDISISGCFHCRQRGMPCLIPINGICSLCPRKNYFFQRTPKN